LECGKLHILLELSPRDDAKVKKIANNEYVFVIDFMESAFE